MGGLKFLGVSGTRQPDYGNKDAYIVPTATIAGQAFKNRSCFPTRRAPRRALRSLEPEEVKAILSQPDRNTLEGQRDHALLALLYNTGVRIQEALNLTPKEVRLTSPAQIRVIGKGQKERICPLWPETVAILKALQKRQPRGDQECIFVNRYGEPLGASGVRFKLRKYVEAAAKEIPSLTEKRVSPHLFRHSTAVHLVAAGVDITVIRSLLGHADLNTTNHYAASKSGDETLGSGDREQPAQQAASLAA